MSMDEKYPLALSEGTILAGQYMIEKVLGQGGFGITYRATDHKTHQKVAVKEFFPDTLAYREMTTVISYPGERSESFVYGKDSFLQEAKTLAEFIGNENIVRIHSYFEENGTAYFVMDYIEGRSFDDYIKEKGGKISAEEAKRILIPVMDALGSVHSKGIVHRDVTPDIAVVQLDNSTDQRKPLTLRVPTEEMQGAVIYAVGFPAISDNSAEEAISKWGKDDVTVTTGVISRLLTVSNRGGTKAIQTDADINPGNSGGPMVDATGSVVGINSWGVSNSSGASVNYAVNIEEAIKLLDRNSIRYTLYADEDPSGGIGAGVIIGIVAAVIVAAAVVVILVMNNKKKGQKTPQAQSAQTSAKKAVIRSMSAQHAGKAFPVGKAPVIIGRNSAECVIVFKEGTPGVSGKHCSIYYSSDTGMFTLTDLNSSFGTFLSNGMKLTANSPINLKPGDSFYVGDKANVIKVEVEQ